MTLSAAANALNVVLHGADAEFCGVSTDTRTLAAGELFVALQGPNFDGHAFLTAAKGRGAVGAMVSRVQSPRSMVLPSIQVPDTRLALGRLAAHWRNRFDLPLVAVTGSNGKTTVKNMLGAILAQIGPGLATQGNLNNDIGVPLTLLRLRREHRYAVIEMGMNHAGEIDYLTHLAQPTVAVITNAAAAHLAGLGSVTNVARAKGEIFAGLRPDGVAVINVDDAHAGLWRELAKARRVMTFGLSAHADVRASFTPQEYGNLIQAATPKGSVTLSLPLPGRHNVLNALAATAASLAAGADMDAVRRGLEGLVPTPGRLNKKRGLSGATVWDDTYNANPGSLAAALEVLTASPGERVLVLGDMGELGEQAWPSHRTAGAAARSAGVNRLWVLGELSKAAVETFGPAGQHFGDADALIAALRKLMHPQMTILVKGSRMMCMERVVTGIVDTGENT